MSSPLLLFSEWHDMNSKFGFIIQFYINTPANSYGFHVMRLPWGRDWSVSGNQSGCGIITWKNVSISWYVIFTTIIYFVLEGVY